MQKKCTLTTYLKNLDIFVDIFFRLAIFIRLHSCKQPVEPCASRPPVKRNGLDDCERGQYTRSLFAHGYVRYIRDHPTDPEQIWDPTFEVHAA